MPETDDLQELVKQIRGGTLQLLEATPEAWMTWVPAGTSNHIAWHAGHAVWLGDVLFVEPITGQSELPEGWSETFGMNCRPVKETTDWPSQEQLLEFLSRQRDRMLQLLSKLPDSGSSDLVRSIIHGLHDEARHQGEVYLLFKLRRAREGPTGRP